MKTSSKFPEEHTEEEEQLLQKYSLLKKLRKQLTELRSRQAAVAETSREKEEAPARPASEDARVAAERLVKLGKIKIQSAACQPRVLMKKGREAAAAATPAYRPYSPPLGEDQQQQQQQQPPAKRPRANLYDSFVSAGVPQPQPETPGSGGGPSSGEPPRRGSTLFVQGYNIHQEMLRAAFCPFGAIARISMETRGGRFNDGGGGGNLKPKAFVTFESEDDAARALEQLDGQLVKGSVLSIRLARKQPGTAPLHRRPLTSDWGSPGGAALDGGGRRRGGLGYDTSDHPASVGDDADGGGGGGGFASPRYAPPDDAPATAPEAASTTAAGDKPPSLVAAAATVAEDAAGVEQRRPLEYSDGVFVSADPMEESAVAELDEVM